MDIEVSVGDYGKMLFDMLLEPNGHLPDHWKSIKKEAVPHLKALIALNDKMKGGGYTITGIKKKGRKVLPKHERIAQAIKAAWIFPTNKLKDGDRYILTNEVFEIQNEDWWHYHLKVVVVGVTGLVYGETSDKLLQRVYDQEVIRIPEDYESERYNDDYWLKIAEVMKI